MPTYNFRSIAELGNILADQTRLRILFFLLNTRATTSELVARLELDQPRVSAHLAALRRSGLVSVSVVGRQHVYAIKSANVADAIRSFFRLAGRSSSGQIVEKVTISRTALREIGRDSPVRRARTCYDHLAGVAGVELLDEIVSREWIEETQMRGRTERTVFNLTYKGRRSLHRLNVQLEEPARAKRLFAYGCLDWTERRYHLGGFLGKAVLDSLLAEGIVKKSGQRNSRAITVCKPITHWFTAHQATSN